MGGVYRDPEAGDGKVAGMPHLIIEYPADRVEAAQVAAAVDAVHGAAVASGLFDPTHVRVRAVGMEHYRLGGTAEPFVHVQCRIHAGRSDAQRKALSEGVLTAIREQRWPLKVITVEVVEMDTAGYTKHVE